MEDLILNALYENPGISPEQLLTIVPEGMGSDVLRVVTFNVFRRIALNEDELLPKSMTLKELALRLDQLIGLAVCRVGREGAMVSGGAGDV